MGRRLPRHPAPRPLDGILLLDKPAGPTSHDLVDVLRRKFGLAKVGHGGTLDPFATGLMVMLIGRGTRLSDRVMGQDKTYEGCLKLGIDTDSQDRDGAVVQERPVPPDLTLERIREAAMAYTGDILQMPPMVSAIKKAGTPLYKLARQGKTVEREPRPVVVHELEVLGFETPMVSFRVRCGKGFYVRTLAADLGRDLGCGAHLDELRRTAIGPLPLSAAVSLPDVEAMSFEDLEARVRATDPFLGRLPAPPTG